MNFYHQPAHRQQQRELNFQPRPLPNTATDLNKTQVSQVRNGNLDPDRVLPPLATSSDGSKFMPFWKRNQQVAAATTHQVVQQQTAQPPKKKWLTQAEMGMTSPAIVPLPIPTARTSTTSTTTTTTNTSTTTNNNVGTTVSSSGSGITASSVTGRTFNYNYNNYNHHVHQFNQPPPNVKPPTFPPPGQAGAPYDGPGYANRAGKSMPSTWQAHAPAALQAEEEEEEEEESQQDESEEDESSSASVEPQYGILDLPSRRHRRAHSQPQWTGSPSHELATKHHVKFKNKKIVYQDPVLPTPSVLVLQTPNNRRSGDYTPAYAYEYSLKYDREGRHSHVERKKGQRSRPKWEETEESESEEEEEGSEEEEEESSPLPPKKKKKSKSGEKKSAKGKSAKAKSKGKKSLVVKNRPTRSRKTRDEDEESDSEEEESKEDEDEDEESGEDEVKRKTKTRMSKFSRIDKRETQNMSMSLQLASLDMNDNHANNRGNPQHRLSRSEDYARHPQSFFSASSRNTPANTSNKWPADLPRLPRSPGTPADEVINTTPGSSYDAPSYASSDSPTKQHNGYFDYQPHQQRREQQTNARPQPYATGSGSSMMTSTNSSTRASTNSTPATSYASMSDRGRKQDTRYMNLDDPPPSSLRRTPSPGYLSSSHSHTRSLPHIGINIITSSSVPMPTSLASSPSSQGNDRTRLVEQSRSHTHQPLPEPQARPQPPETAGRSTQCPSSFRTSHTFWQQQQQQAQQAHRQHPPHPSPQPPQRSLPTASGSNGSTIGSSFGTGALNGYRNVQTPAPASVPAPQAPSPSRRRELPPQPAQGHERAQEILREAMERQTQVHNPPLRALQQEQQQQQPPRQWQPAPRSGTSVPASSFAPPVQHHQRLPQSSFPQQQQQARQPLPHPQQSTQPTPSIQQHRPPLPQQPPQSQYPHQQQRPQQSQYPVPLQRPQQSQHPVPPPQRSQPAAPQHPQSLPPQHAQPPPQRSQPAAPQHPQSLPPQHAQPPTQRSQPAAPQHPQSLPHQHARSLPPQPAQSLPPSQPARPLPPQQPRPPPQLPIHQHQRPESRPLSRMQPQLHQPPQAQRHVYRRPSMPVESPLPVGGRDRTADIPRMGEAASVASASEYGSGDNVSVSESEAESLQSASQGGDETNDNDADTDAIPGIVVNVAGDDDRSSNWASSVASSPQLPVIHVQEEGQRTQTPSPAVPQIQVVDVPGISFTGPEEDGGGPSITISVTEDNPSPIPKFLPMPATSSPQQRARSAPALVTLDRARRNQGGLSCGGCGGPIMGRIVNAMGARWHPECFKCTTCNTLLEHVSSYEHDGKPYCHLDYHENFAPRCYHCKTAIIEERFISLDDPALGKRTYHEPHFFCAECGDPFLAPSSSDFETDEKWSGELALSGDGEFESDNVGFTVYRGHPYCESCHVRLRLPKCKRCKKSIRDGDRAVEALGGKWCWACFVCESCQKPFEDPAFFQRAEKPYCEPCFSLMLRNEV